MDLVKCKEWAMALVRWQIEGRITANPYAQIVLSELITGSVLESVSGCVTIKTGPGTEDGEEMEEIGVRFPTLRLKCPDGNVVCTTSMVTTRLPGFSGDLCFVVRPEIPWCSTEEIDAMVELPIQAGAPVHTAVYGTEVLEPYFCKLVDDEAERTQFRQCMSADFGDLAEYLEIPKSDICAETSDCPLCLSSMLLLECGVAGNDSGLERLVCGHMFHTKCIETWYKKELESGRIAICPICRKGMHTGF